MKRLLRLVVIGGLVLLLIFVGLLYFGVNERYAEIRDSGITVEVRRGMAVSQVTRLLQERGLIRSSALMKIYIRLFRPGVRFLSGEYLFQQPMDIPEIVDKLASGDVVLYRLTVREGLTIGETAEWVERERGIPAGVFQAAARRGGLIGKLDPEAPDLEGYLYPDTYFIPREMGGEELVKTMVERFLKHFTEKMQWRARESGFTVREVVTLASLIEKETALRKERFLISSVFHNRLKKGMTLGCDPTIIYALKKKGEYQGSLRWKDLKMDSPYNTRMVPGLPPGPICSVGVESIEAALYPKPTEYLYFVAKDDRSHYFSKTLREHNRAVKKYIIDR